MLAGVAEHGRPEVVVQPQQAVTRYPPHKDFYYTYEYMSKTFQHIVQIQSLQTGAETGVFKWSGGRYRGLQVKGAHIGVCEWASGQIQG